LVGNNFVADAKNSTRLNQFFYIVKVETSKRQPKSSIRQNIYELDGGFMKWSDEGLNNAKNKLLKYTGQSATINNKDKK
jgi:hypothetical protein